jgi:hypothetical protein
MAIIGKAINEAIQEKDAEKAVELDQRIGELEKQLGREYLAFVDDVRNIDLNSKDGQEILSIFDSLDKSCPQ